MGKAALKNVLKNFLDHFENLECRRNLGFENDLYHKEFQSLKDLTEKLKKDPYYSCVKGLEEVNIRKNRYKDILPYDYSRVILSEHPGVPGSDYINANYVKGSTGSTCAYIASQGPLCNTLSDFFKLIWEERVTVIVMACNETESGKYKCEVYWPQTTDQDLQFNNITVSLVKWKQICPDFLVRTLKIKCNNEERIICQFHYTTWPDHGVPSSVSPILELVRLIRDVQASEARPILIHCSAGCGRTGTICSIDFVWALLRSGKLNEDFSLFSIISDMRRQRIAMVQTKEQYILCYRAVAKLFEQQLKMIEAHLYENLNENGEPLLNSENESINEENLENDLESSNSSSFKENKIQNNFSKKKNSFGSLKKTRLHKSTPDFETDYFHQNENNKIKTNKQEKLIGKATVIRRPSIAHLKAMFENMNNSDTDSYPRHYNRNKKNLKRSMSTREKVGYFDTWTSSNLNSFGQHGSFTNVSNLNLNDDWKKNSSNFLKNSESSSNDEIDSNINKKNNLEIDSFNQNKFINGSHYDSSLVKENDVFKKENETFNSFLEQNEEEPPPKPPRTYQYNESLSNSNTYDIIKNNYMVDNKDLITDEYIYSVNKSSSVKNQKYYNTIGPIKRDNRPNLFCYNDDFFKEYSYNQSKSYFNLPGLRSNESQPINNFKSNKNRSLSINEITKNNLYENSINNDINSQPNYGMIQYPVNDFSQLQSTNHQQIYQSNFNDDLKTANYNAYLPKTQDNQDFYGYINPNNHYMKLTNSNVTKPMNPHFSNTLPNFSATSNLNNNIKPNFNIPAHQKINTPMSYVRPMINNSTIESKKFENSNIITKPSNLISANIKNSKIYETKQPHSTFNYNNATLYQKIPQFSNINQKINQQESNYNSQNYSLKDKLVTVNLNSNEEKLKINNFNLHNVNSNKNIYQNPDENSFKKELFNKKQVLDSKVTPNNVKEKTKKTFNFSSFFGLKKKKDKKLNINNCSTNNMSTISLNPVNNVPINGNNLNRPPHSHRFSPPAQWTQV